MPMTSKFCPCTFYLCLCYKHLGQAFICSQVDPCKSHTAGDPCALDSCRDSGVSTASSCVPVTPLIELRPHYLRLECFLLLLRPSPHTFTPANSFLPVMSQLKSHFLPEVFSNQDSACPLPVIRHCHIAICNCIFISYYFFHKNKNCMKSRTVSFFMTRYLILSSMPNTLLSTLSYSALIAW